MTEDRRFPPALAAVAECAFDYDDGIDFEPYTEFSSAEDTRSWIRSWTGNQELDGSEFRVFGQDGTGGLAMFWTVREGADLVDQPVVFFGSEGAAGVVARDLAAFLWLLADGLGPMEVVEYADADPNPNEELRDVAEKFAADRRQSGVDVVADVRREFPDFEATVTAWCR
ncbi:hypothetical protein SUDANB95_03661 [Actinosynnema sp. ALI-1.44]